MQCLVMHTVPKTLGVVHECCVPVFILATNLHHAWPGCWHCLEQPGGHTHQTTIAGWGCSSWSTLAAQNGGRCPLERGQHAGMNHTHTHTAETNWPLLCKKLMAASTSLASGIMSCTSTSSLEKSIQMLSSCSLCPSLSLSLSLSPSLSLSLSCLPSSCLTRIRPFSSLSCSTHGLQCTLQVWRSYEESSHPKSSCESWQACHELFGQTDTGEK